MSWSKSYPVVSGIISVISKIKADEARKHGDFKGFLLPGLILAKRPLINILYESHIKEYISPAQGIALHMFKSSCALCATCYMLSFVFFACICRFLQVFLLEEEFVAEQRSETKDMN